MRERVASLLRQTVIQAKKRLAQPTLEAPPPSILLYDFSAPDAADSWMCTSDSEIGGSSSAK
jgi:hypothetical protein